jgi:outer membrane cobalamin receptor
MIPKYLYNKVIFLILLSSLCFGQTEKYLGIVSNSKSNLPLKGANVFLKNYTIGTITDNDGFFSLGIPIEAQNDTLVVTYLGFVDYMKPIDKLPLELSIYLNPKILSLEEEIIIYGDKIDLARKEIPHTSQTITAKEISNYGSTEISDLFKIDPSIQVEGNELDGKRIQIRGSDADEVNVYIDGILLNSIGFENEADLSAIPTENIQKIEILKGANLMLLGNGAFGGVVNITSKRKLYSEYSTKIKFGSSKSKYLSADINLPLKEKLYFNYFGMWNEILPEIEFYESERFSDKTEGQSISLTKQNHHIGLNYFTETGQLTTKLIGYFFDYSKADWTDTRNNLLLASSFKGDLFGLTEMDISLNYTNNSNKIKRGVSLSQFFINEYKTQRLNLRGAKNFNLKNDDNFYLDFQLLSEYYHDEAASDNIFENHGNRSDLYHSYLYDNRASIAGVVSFGDLSDSSSIFSWKGFTGIRGDFLSSGSNFKTNNFGLQFDISKKQWKLSPFLSYGENVKFPTLLEQAYVKDLVDLSIGNTGESNVNLKPEYVAASEIGIKFIYEPLASFYNRLTINTAFFSNRIFNKLIERPIQNIIIKNQIGENTINGFESSIVLHEVLSNFNLSLGYLGLDISNPLIYTYKPEVKFNFRMNYQSLSGIYFNSTYFYEGHSTALYYDDYNIIQEETISPFFDVDLSLGYRFKINKVKLNLQIAGYNILDNSSYKFYYLKKRFVQGSVGITY